MSANMTEAQIPADPAPRAIAASTSPTRVARMKKELTMLAVMLGLAGLTSALNPVFLGVDNLRNTIRHISFISLFALGEAVVIITASMVSSFFIRATRAGEVGAAMGLGAGSAGIGTSVMLALMRHTSGCWRP